jgi:hypothetical protein
MASPPNYALDISLGKGANAQAAVLNLGTDTQIVLDGGLTIGGDLLLAGPVIELATATSVGGPVLVDVVNQTATGQTLQISAGGPPNATSTSSVTIGTQVLGNALTVVSAPIVGTQVEANAPFTATQMSTSGATNFAAMPCPVTSSGAVVAFTPAGPNGPLTPGLYAVLIGPGTDAGVNAPAYTSSIAYLDNTGEWTCGGAAYPDPQIAVVTAAVNGIGVPNLLGTRLAGPPSNQMVFVNGTGFGCSAGLVTIYFRNLFAPEPGQEAIPPFPFQ